MIQKIKKFLGIEPTPDLNEWVSNGAIILDVRTKSEYKSGHVKGSINIPLQELSAGLGKLKDKDRPIITCCASGMRSGSAKAILRTKGYSKVHNGGSWYNLQRFEK